MNAKAKKCNSFDEFDFEPGSYCFMSDKLKDGQPDIFMTLPSGDNFRPDGRWQITNADDPDKITITPSIDCKGTTRWHGFLTNGEFKEC